MATNEETDFITKQLNDMRVTDAERACVFHLREGTIDESKQKLENVILCKVFTSKTINPEMFCSKMPKIWSQEQTMIACVGFNLFLCKFKNACIKGKIIESGLWFFDKAMLLMEDPKGDSCGEETEFRYVSFWIHFHKLPFACFSRNTTMEIGSQLEKVEQIDLEDGTEQHWGISLRIKIQVEVSSPLKCGIFLKK